MIGPTLGFSPQLSAPLGMTDTLTDGGRKPSLAEAAKGFESIFLSTLLKEMRQTLEPGSMFGKDGGDIYGGLFDQFMAQHLTQGKGIGIAQSLMRQLEPTTPHETPPASQPLRT